MQDLYNTLDELCEKVSKELGKANEKLTGNMSAGDVEFVDKLTHMLKSIKTTMAMMDSEGYSSDAYGNMGGYSRRTYPRRDSMGRYSGRGYSRGYSMDSGEMVEELRTLMNSAPDERTRREFQSFIDRMERM